MAAKVRELDSRVAELEVDRKLSARVADALEQNERARSSRIAKGRDWLALLVAIGAVIASVAR